MNTYILLAATLLLKFFVHWLLIGSHLLKPLNQQDSVEVVKTLLFYGFCIALVVIVLFFLFPPLASTPSAQEIVEKTMARYQLGEVAVQAQMDVSNDTTYELTQLTGTITTLQRQGSKTVHEALSALTMGNVMQAKAMFHNIIQAHQPVVHEVATAYQHLGALAYWDNTQEALHAYQRAVDLDPINPLGWKQLGRLLLRRGQLEGAEQAFEEVLALSATDDPYTAMAYGNLGVIELTRENLPKAESLFQRALELDIANDDKYGMATDYGNLGNVYYFQGQLTAAEEMHQKALFLNQAIDNKKGIARDYNNLALIKAAENDMQHAEILHEKALAISLAIGHKEDIARDYLNLGVTYHSNNAFHEAIKMYEQALTNSQLIEDIEMMAMIYDNLGLVHYQQADLATAEQMFQEAIALYYGLNLQIKVSLVCERMRHAAFNESVAQLPACQTQPTLLSML